MKSTDPSRTPARYLLHAVTLVLSSAWLALSANVQGADQTSEPTSITITGTS